MNRFLKDSLKDWVPYQWKEENGETGCRWLYLGDHHFTEPFFDETIMECRRLFEINRRKTVLSAPELLPEWSGALDAIAPTALIFHVSRCGSTLLAQLLSQLTDSIVLSEVPFIDACLRRHFHSGNSLENEAEALAAIRFYAQPRRPGDRRVFLKTDSWHLHFHAFWNKHFPDTPRVFLYRHPAEVIRSQQKRRGMQAVPGMVEPAVFGLPEEVRNMTDFDQYMGRVLASYFREMLRQSEKDERILLCNYTEGMATVATRLLEATGEKIDKTLMDNWAERSRYHGKYPGEKFHEEPLTSQPPAWMEELMVLYQELEKRRLTARPTS